MIKHDVRAITAHHHFNHVHPAKNQTHLNSRKFLASRRNSQQPNDISMVALPIFLQ